MMMSLLFQVRVPVAEFAHSLTGCARCFAGPTNTGPRCDRLSLGATPAAGAEAPAPAALTPAAGRRRSLRRRRRRVREHDEPLRGPVVGERAPAALDKAAVDAPAVAHAQEAPVVGAVERDLAAARRDGLPQLARPLAPRRRAGVGHGRAAVHAGAVLHHASEAAVVRAEERDPAVAGVDHEEALPRPPIWEGSRVEGFVDAEELEP
jgi:hypothetical protein